MFYYIFFSKQGKARASRFENSFTAVAPVHQPEPPFCSFSPIPQHL